MIRTNFYLEKRKNIEGELIITNMPIYLFASFEGHRLQYYTRERIDLKYWNDKKQRVVPSYPGSLEINAYLDKLEGDVTKAYREARILGNVITTEDLKELLNGTHVKESDKTLFNYYEEFLDSNKFLAKSTHKKTVTVLNHLKSFSSEYGYKIKFDSINDRFFANFIEYSTSKLLHTNNTIHRHVGVIKWFLRWATKKGYNKTLSFNDFKVKEYETEIIALSSAELQVLLKTEMPNQRLQQVKDAFCFCCFTGLRYSDLKNLKKSDLLQDSFRITTIKTKSVLTIPLLNEAKEILFRYSDYPTPYALPVISNQKMNDFLKEVGKICGFDDPITIVRFRGNERIEIIAPKYELLTTHVGRKTFVSVSFERGMRAEIIMQISGHKNPKVFDRYNKIQYSTISEELYSAFKNK